MHTLIAYDYFINGVMTKKFFRSTANASQTPEMLTKLSEILINRVAVWKMLVQNLCAYFANISLASKKRFRVQVQTPCTSALQWNEWNILWILSKTKHRLCRIFELLNLLPWSHGLVWFPAHKHFINHSQNQSDTKSKLSSKKKRLCQMLKRSSQFNWKNLRLMNSRSNPI